VQIDLVIAEGVQSAMIGKLQWLDSFLSENSAMGLMKGKVTDCFETRPPYSQPKVPASL